MHHFVFVLFMRMRENMSKHPIANNTKESSRPLVRESVSATLLFSDIIAMSLAFTLAFSSAQFLKDVILPDIYNKPLTDYKNISDLIFVWMCPFVLFAFFTKGHYTQRLPWWSLVQHVLVICLIAFILDGFMRFAIKMSFSRLLIGLSWVYVFLLVLAMRQIVYRFVCKLGIWRIPTIVIGDGRTVVDTLYAFKADHYTGYDVRTIALRDETNYEFKLEKVPPEYQNINIIKEAIDYKEYIQNNIDHFFVVTLETFRGEERDSLIKTLTQNNALYAVIPPISRMSLFEMEPRYFFGHDVMLLHANNSIFSPMGKFMKRSMDILVSLIAMTILLPIMLIIATCLKLEGQGGSALYGGYRIGKNGKKFRCWKFRSMEPNSDHLLDALLENDPRARADWEEFRKLKQPDPRVTTLTAKIIRKTSLDELPQLWNVLKGDMSLVGPRPIIEEEVELFGDSIDQYMRVRPGITGLWQVSGRSDASFERRVYWDSWYVRNWSLWGDVVILIKTLRVVCCGSGAY